MTSLSVKQEFAQLREEDRKNEVSDAEYVDGKLKVMKEMWMNTAEQVCGLVECCLLYTSPSPRDS